MIDRLRRAAGSRFRRAVFRFDGAFRMLGAEPDFVIIGTGRSGTGYISQLLTAGGIRCGHEGWWSPLDRRSPFLAGDASWCATFELEGFTGRIFHQIRDPLLTMRSVAAVELAPRSHSRPWYRYRETIVDLTGDPVVDALLTVDRWLDRAEQIAEWTWRLEDVDEELIAAIGARVGRSVDREKVREAMTTASRNEKTAIKDTVYDFSWDELPDGPEKQRVLAIADRYGYT